MTTTTAGFSPLIKAFGPVIHRGGPRRREDIDEFESMFDVRLPSDFRQFLLNYGVLAGETVHIYGLPGAEDEQPSLAAATLTARLSYDDMPLDVVPIQQIEGDLFACQTCPSDSTAKRPPSAPIVLLDIAQPLSSAALTAVASSFTEYLINLLVAALPDEAKQQEAEDAPRRQADEAFEKAWAHFIRHVKAYNNKHQYDHAKGGKLPRSTDWRPYRYCIQDVVFGAVVVRHEREANCLEVDVFLTADVPAYGPLAGARALAHFLLSEAYQCGGTMEIRFKDQVEGGRVPAALRALADHYGIGLTEGILGHIVPTEAKALYAALTGFPPALRGLLEALDAAGRLRLARTCFVVNHGVWSREQVELIALGSERPDSILGGLAQPQQRHLYYHDLCHARAALMADMLLRLLRQRERLAGDTSYEMEDDLRLLAVEFDPDDYAQVVRCDEELPLPWLYEAQRPATVPGGMAFSVLLRPRDAADLLPRLTADIRQAAEHRRRRLRPTSLLVPYDFMTLEPTARERLSQMAREAQVGLLVCPETAAAFDAEAARRLARSRILRQ